ncbi:MAG: hypothetical protein UR50_C0007G0015, partial [Parcubacteria group bacterium GW2011_GWC1_34_10]
MLVEKAIGLTDEHVACPVEITMHAAKLLAKCKSPSDAQNALFIAKEALNLELSFCHKIEEIYELLKQN